jgi:5-methylcytosine-specific restriction protein A
MRSTEEWIGTSDDQSIPARVKIRVFDAFGGRCAVCTLQIAGKLRPAYDHAIALINGGENRETNLQLLCVPCHALKTKADVAEKSVVARVRAKHLRLHSAKRKIQSAGFQKSAPQKTASRPIERRT